jgi:hypothetical protein
MSNWSTYPTRHKWGKRQSDVPDKKTAVLQLIILILAIYWLLSFFGQSIVPGVPHTARFIDLLAVIIVILIIVKFLSYESSRTFNLLMVIDIFSKSILS